MRNGGTGATPPGAILPVGEGSDPLGLDRWAAPPVWPLGRWGTRGVCASPPDTAGGIPWKTEKGRGSDVCGEARAWPTKCLGALRVPQVGVVRCCLRLGDWVYLGAS